VTMRVSVRGSGSIGPVARFVLKSAAMCFRACDMPGTKRVLKSRLW
jgi:hypothetical protein